MYKKIIACLVALTLVFTSVNFSEVQAAKLKLNKKQVLVRKGSKVKLKVKGNKKKKVKWKTSNKKIATVSKKGVVKGIKDGRCNITAKVGKKKVKCKVVCVHKVAKTVTAKTLSKIGKKIKSNGLYVAEEGCYRYIKKFNSDNEMVVAILKHFPKDNHIEMEMQFGSAVGVITYRVGDKRRCKFDYTENGYQVNIQGYWNTSDLSKKDETVEIVNTNIPYSYLARAKSVLYENFEYTMGKCFDDMMKDLKTNIYSEDLGVNWPQSVYFG